MFAVVLGDNALGLHAAVKLKEIATMSESDKLGKKVLALDVGSTGIRAFIYDKQATIVGKCTVKIKMHCLSDGKFEIHPDVLWEQVQGVIKSCLDDAHLTAADITCMGITVQRNTFITWDRETGEPFHNFISWSDTRAIGLVNEWNASFLMKVFNYSSYLLYLITRKPRFHTGFLFKFMTPQVVIRLLWQLKHIPELRKKAKEGQAVFATIDSWLLWKLTGGRELATDYSCACATAMFDFITMQWSSVILGMVGIPRSLLPPVKETSGLFGKCLPELFGAAIPITAMVGDQSASLFGQCCFDLNDVKCTMGGGMFVNCNTGSAAIISNKGTYPQIAWKIGNDYGYMVEGIANDCGSCIDWALSVGLIDDLDKLTEAVQSVPDSGGVYFVPAFSGLQAPINDESSCACFIGVKRTTTRAHMARAILESIAFRLLLLFECMNVQCRKQHALICKCDGGVTNSEFVMQLLADLTGRRLATNEYEDMSALGAAYLAGLHMGVWESTDELRTLEKMGTMYTPRPAVQKKYADTMANWRKAVGRARHWYTGNRL